MKHTLRNILNALLLSLALPMMAQAQVQTGWPDPENMFPTHRSQQLQPILDFPTEGQAPQLATVAYQSPLERPMAMSDELSLIDANGDAAWIEPQYSHRVFPGRANDLPIADPLDTTPYEWTLLPAGPVYKSYMAGVKESRLSAHLMKITDDNWMLDGTLGGRFGVMRWGRESATGFLAEGVQWDIEGSAQVRLDIPEEVDVRCVDFRAGTQLTWSYADNPAHRSRFGYYHLSSHLGDEFLLKNPTYPRLNYAHDLLIFGHSYYFTPKLRVYGEVGWAFYHLESDPWEFQFGVEWSPTRKTSFWGEPFLAVGCHLREEVNFGGSFVVQTGWAWVGEIPGRTFRMGMHYHNGDSTQNSFFDNFEQQIGFGIWYDF
ncbi:DUF1207 domain-containing protein [Bremerella cremea]|nr:DUF1207 domain-containing protein [Bremerella cremea]